MSFQNLYLTCPSFSQFFNTGYQEETSFRDNLETNYDQGGHFQRGAGLEDDFPNDVDNESMSSLSPVNMEEELNIPGMSYFFLSCHIKNYKLMNIKNRGEILFWCNIYFSSINIDYIF